MGGRTITACRPSYAVSLTNGAFRQQIGFRTKCSDMPFVIQHGTTRIVLNVITTYTECAEPGGTVTPSSPPCSAFGMPPLPAGTYKALLVWSQTVPLPKPRSVEVTIEGSRPTDAVPAGG